MVNQSDEQNAAVEVAAGVAKGPQIHFYTRNGCGLCDIAFPILADVASDYGIEPTVVDIESAPELEERFGTLIPVVAIDGNVVFTYRVDPDLARRLIERAIAGARA